MALNGHIRVLEQKHAEFEKLIKDEMTHPLPDFGNISEMKKQKLKVKEELSKLRMSPERFEYAS